MDPRGRGRGRGDRGRGQSDAGGGGGGGGGGGRGDYHGGGRGDYHGGRGGGPSDFRGGGRGSGDYRGGRGDFHGGRGGGGDRGGRGDFHGGRGGGDFHGGGRGGGRGGGSSQYKSDELTRAMGKINLNEVISMPLKDEKLALVACGRQGVGQCGRKIPLLVNYFEILTKIGHVEKYHVAIEFENARGKLRINESREVFALAIQKVASDQHMVVYDGGNICYSTGMLNLTNGSEGRVEEEFKFGDEKNRGRRCMVDFQHTGRVYVDLSKVVDSNLLQRDSESLQVLDVILRQMNNYPLIKTKYVATRQSFYREPKYPCDLGVGREAWMGYYCAAHVLTGNKPFLNIDTSATAFYKEQPAMDFMVQVLASKFASWRTSSRPNHLTPQDRLCFEKEIKGLRVAVHHTNGNGHKNGNGNGHGNGKKNGNGNGGTVRIFRVNGVSKESAKTLKFMVTEGDNDGKEMTVDEYFTKRYFPLKNADMPCLHVGSKKKQIFMPIEACTIYRGQKCNKKLTEEQTSNMIKAVCQPAPQRMKEIMSQVEEAGFHNDPFSRAFGVSVKPEMARVEGRVLNPPSIVYANNITVAPNISKGSWDNQRKQFFKAAAPIETWGLVSFVPQRDQRALEDFSVQFAKQAGQLGLKMKQYPDGVAYIVGDGFDQVKKAFETCLHQARTGTNNPKLQFNFVLVVFQGRDSTRYGDAKRFAEIDDNKWGCITQGVQFNTIRKSLRENLERGSSGCIDNILLKLNTKLGGINCSLAVDDTVKKFFHETTTMVFGVDVTHPPPSERTNQKAEEDAAKKDGRAPGIVSPSIAAITASVSEIPVRFLCYPQLQKPGREHVVDLAERFKTFILAFHYFTKKKPDRLLVYRDGVSEGQIKEVLKEEVQSIKTACMMISKDYRPRITYIVVLKRHHVRMFCANLDDSVGKAQNIPPGTVVDNMVVHPTGNDFLLCSHFGIQGTSRPTHYNVVYDESGLSGDALQIITYAMCHVYMRCPRPVSVPAPTYYADLVCTRARYHLQRKLGDSSSDGDSQSQATGTSRPTGPKVLSEGELIRGMTLHSNLDAQNFRENQGQKGMYFI